MTMKSHLTLQEKLQNEFCPPLDTSLLAALIAEIEFEAASQSRPVSSEQIHDLRKTLSQLAVQAEKDESPSENLIDIPMSPRSFTTDESSVITDDVSPGNTVSSATSDTSSQQSFSSPLGFLRAAFPQASTALLKRTLESAVDDENVDMEAVVEQLLTDEYLHDLEERGLDGLDDVIVKEIPWETVQAKAKKKTRTGPPTVKHGKGKTITITDIRQQQHARPSVSRRSSSPGFRGAPDLWTQISSLSSYLSTLLPQPASFFQSVFHRPEYSSPSEALRLTLVSMGENSDLSPQDTLALFNMFEVLTSSPVYSNLDGEQRKQIMADAELALRATGGRCNEALDIVWLLRDLDSDDYLEMGVYHSPVTPSSIQESPWTSLPSSSTIKTSPVLRQKQTNGVALGQPSLVAKSKTTIPPPQHNAWQQIPLRKPSNGIHPLASYIPSYNVKVRGGGNSLGKGGKGDVGELTPAQNRKASRTEEWRMKRNEALREASRYWQSGSAHTRGGEVALFFAERAREYHDMEHAAALEAARRMVEAKRTNSGDKRSVDLHGTTVAEAIVIVEDILREEGASPAKPLHIITGRGTHSANRTGVLGPAVKSALVERGWTVSTFDGGLVVRAKTHNNR